MANITVMEMLSADISLNGYVKRRGPTPPGGLYLFNFQTDPLCNFHTAFDFVRFYISRATLEGIAYEAGMPVTGSLARPELGAVDPVLFNLAKAALPALENIDSASQLFIDYLCLAFHTHVICNYTGPCRDISRTRPGLAPWQVRTATELISAGLDGKVSIDELASACNLSQSYFSRAFLQTLGMPPHRYLLHRRVDRAKALLSLEDRPLLEIALLCGFATQSHFTRVFTAVEGVSPGRWRRRAASLETSSQRPN
ncbi:AraC family transcriptional regulator [Luteibacter sp. UNCMF331Sha3.1]|uniref:helix-turn-helix domain-containing protein n=1 Tax=Luteibacter sp. UNCMF331Sha3.1 TaxID=1502760 RepID=UPI00147B27A0|nr:AraC family transcriptional regulator [Luteibacter sp. UNCMF331Sha3.1]